MKNVNLYKRYICAAFLISLFFISGCSQSDKVDPDDFIKESYQNGQQLAMIETENQQLRLMTYDNQYELVKFKKVGDSYQYNGGYITKKPYIQNLIKDNDDVYVTVVIDNTIVEADSYTLEMKASETDSIILKAQNLLKNEPYLIKSYLLPSEYDLMELITFYDKNGDTISTDDLGSDVVDNVVGNFHK